MTFSSSGSSSDPQTSRLTADTDVNANSDSINNRGIIGKVLIRNISLIQKNGIEVDLNGSYDTITFFEDLYSTNISGSVSINDFVGGLEKFYISGGEKLKITIVKSTNGEIIIDRSDLVIYRVTAGEVSENFNTKYNLLFVSKHYINGLKKKLFKSYVNISWNRVARAVFGSMQAESTLATHSSLDLNLEVPFLCTGISPIEALKRFANRATYIGGRYYTLFERVFPMTKNNTSGGGPNQTSFFTSLESLKVKGDQAYNVLYSPRTQGLSAITDSLSNNYIRAAQLVRMDNFNHIDYMLSGLYNSRIVTLDHLKKDETVISMSYLGDRKLPETILPEKDFYPNRILDSKTNNPFAKYGENEYPGERLVPYSNNDIAQKQDWIPKHLLGFMLDTLYRVQVVIDGSTNNLCVGDSVNLKVPSKFRKHRSSDPVVLDDEMLSGYYLVTSVRHTITNVGVYTKRVEMGRGSLSVDLDEKFSMNNIITTQPKTTFETANSSATTSNTSTQSTMMPGIIDPITKTFDGLPLFDAPAIASGAGTKTSSTSQNNLSSNLNPNPNYSAILNNLTQEISER